MDDAFIKRGGCAGAAIAFLVTAATTLLLYFSKSPSPSKDEFWGVIWGLFCFGFFPALLGHFAGMEGARSKDVRSAFIKGGVFFGFAISIYFAMALLGVAMGGFGINALLATADLACLTISTGSLISGMAAIVVRDYQQFGRMRIVPQFSLQELMIVTTLMGIILGALMSIPLLKV
jgi:hypothetical protein